ncbi:unnamed protein product [Prorocentrum cordatum]|uniref:Uncharacterized protein n=1 Tax=Prorocentrum cordatum TaxID=2364126 RepID=A0ABN9S0I5_9DINO|nr:unnamed protein product [Polarella glacialis]
MALAEMTVAVNGASCPPFTGLPGQVRLAVSTERQGDIVDVLSFSAPAPAPTQELPPAGWLAEQGDDLASATALRWSRSRTTGLGLSALLTSLPPVWMAI